VVCLIWIFQLSLFLISVTLCYIFLFSSKNTLLVLAFNFSCKVLALRFCNVSSLIYVMMHLQKKKKLKTESGAWLSDRASIGATFVNHFSKLFSSSAPTIEEEMLNLFEPSISDLKKMISLFSSH
jgi:hypothetical protein